jgi:hypothetical protein
VGLDIMAFSKLKKTDHKIPSDQWCEEEGHHQAYIISPDFYQSLKGLEENYCYAETPETESISFHGGSYGGYNVRRSQLWKMATGLSNDTWPDNVDALRDLPFFELVYFADNEGTIGSEAAVQLYGDFKAYHDQWNAEHTTEHERYNNWYENFMRACELAADNGLIDFH